MKTRGWRIYKVVGCVKHNLGCRSWFWFCHGTVGQVPPHIYSIPVGDHDGFFCLPFRFQREAGSSIIQSVMVRPAPHPRASRHENLAPSGRGLADKIPHNRSRRAA
jgi:hypothetical protein